MFTFEACAAKFNSIAKSYSRPFNINDLVEYDFHPTNNDTRNSISIQLQYHKWRQRILVTFGYRIWYLWIRDQSVCVCVSSEREALRRRPQWRPVSQDASSEEDGWQQFQSNQEEGELRSPNRIATRKRLNRSLFHSFIHYFDHSSINQSIISIK